MSYSVNQDLYNIYGEDNIRKWADVDNEASNETINNRMTWARELAENWINSRLKDGPYTVPLAGTDKVVIDIEARMAGVILYDSRRVTDQDPQGTDELNIHRKIVNDNIQQILRCRLRLAGETEKVACYPQAFSGD